jgi:hypothetical protein
MGMQSAATNYSGARRTGCGLRSLHISPTQYLITNLDQEVLPAMWDRIAFGICTRIDETSKSCACDTAASKFVTHHLIVKPVQNLP